MVPTFVCGSRLASLLSPWLLVVFLIIGMLFFCRSRCWFRRNAVVSVVVDVFNVIVVVVVYVVVVGGDVDVRVVIVLVLSGYWVVVVIVVVFYRRYCGGGVGCGCGVGGGGVVVVVVEVGDGVLFLVDVGGQCFLWISA